MAVKLTFKLFHLFVQSMCVLVTVVLACLCFYKFLLDDDLAQVNFQTFNDNNHALYPSVTLCFMGPSIFLEDKLTLLGEGINARNYAHFLKGLLWNNTMSEVDFDDVTIKIEDYLEGVIISSSGDNARHCSKNFHKILSHFSVSGCVNTSHYEDFPTNTFNFYVSYRDYQTKCFSMDVPYIKGSKLNRLRIFIKSHIFPQFIDKEYVFEKNFGVFLHYPRQLFRSPIRKLYQNVQDQLLLKVMKFKMQNIEVLIRRNKPSQKCNEDWKKDDVRILRKIASGIGCQPPHWKLAPLNTLKKNLKVTKCSDKKKMQLFSRHSPLAYLVPNIAFLNNLPPPCQDVTQVLSEYKEDQWSKEEFKELDVEADFFEINLSFPSSVYKEIVQIRAYGFQSLVGYVGGYVGMFLGLGLSQLPTLLMKAMKRLRKSKPIVENVTPYKTEHQGSNSDADALKKIETQLVTGQKSGECDEILNDVDFKFDSCSLNELTIKTGLPLSDSVDANKNPFKEFGHTQTGKSAQERISIIEQKIEWLYSFLIARNDKDVIVQ